MKNPPCPLLEQYINYLLVIRGRSENTAKEYRTDLNLFFSFVLNQHQEKFLQILDAEFIKGITLGDMYAFIAYCQEERHSSPGTRARKIVSIRQFWKYLKTKLHLIENNLAEELETPTLPKRSPKYLSLEESVRLLMQCEKSPRDHCILTIFLNCALRLSELISINVDQVDNDVLYIVGKGNKERRVFLTPAAKKSINNWMQIRRIANVPTNALFISRDKRRISARAVQNVVRKYITAAGLNPQLITPHKLRHTAATLMYKYGRVDLRSLQQILGHESVATTEIYTHIDERQLQSAVNSNPLAVMFS